MTALVRGIAKGTQVPLGEDYDANELLFKREGLVGFDIFGLNRSYTPWQEIAKIIVNKDDIEFISRFPEDINRAFIDPEHHELVIQNISPIPVTPENRRQFSVKYELDPLDERCVLFWRDQRATLVLYLRQSKFLGTLSDAVPVYSLQIPEIEIKCKINGDKEWNVKNEVNVPGEVTVIERRAFGSFHELGNELHKNPVITNNKRLKVRYDSPGHQAQDEGISG